jgi:hypothetical protein
MASTGLPGPPGLVVRVSRSSWEEFRKMSDVFKKLAQSQVPSSATAIYTAPPTHTAIIKHISCVNPTGSGNVTLTMWQDGTTNAKLILPAATVLEGGWAEFDGAIEVDASGVIYAQASSNNVMTITLHGMEVLI